MRGNGGPIINSKSLLSAGKLNSALTIHFIWGTFAGEYMQ